MKWLAIPIEELKEFDKDWEIRRMSNDGTKALLHEETYNMFVPPIMMLSEGEEVVEEVVYPYPWWMKTKLTVLMIGPVMR